MRLLRLLPRRTTAASTPYSRLLSAASPRRERSSFSPEDAAGQQRLATLPSSLESLGLKYLERNDLRARFDEIDSNASGAIEVDEARRLLVSAGRADATLAEAQSVVDSMDCNANGRVEWEEFRSAVDRAADPVDRRIYPISASLMLNFTG